MILHTQIPIEPKDPKIDFKSKVLLIGSCFVENIGSKLDYLKFDTLQNPFGILFHPIAIERIISRAINNELFTESDIFFEQDRWNCFEVHSSLSLTDKIEYLNYINERLSELADYLISATHVVFTYGTSWVYRQAENDIPVANCYKLPQSNFTKELLDVDTVEISIINTVELIKKVNPEAAIITTVSPVRHVKDGIVENNRSKAHLISALHAVIEKRNRVYYFPSYEIMMDELRDYRFFEMDMIHPNETAITIIWDKFIKTWISDNTNELRKEIESIRSAMNHRPFDSNSKQHREFLEKLELRISSLQEQYPFIKF